VQSTELLLRSVRWCSGGVRAFEKVNSRPDENDTIGENERTIDHRASPSMTDDVSFTTSENIDACDSDSLLAIE
jgi:hypothetical protein